MNAGTARRASAVVALLAFGLGGCSDDGSDDPTPAHRVDGILTDRVLVTQ